MPGDIGNQLKKGTRSDIEAACRTVETEFRQIADGLRRGTNDALYALRYELSVLRHICIAVKENPQQNGDLYGDMVAVMLPHVRPCEEKASLWETHLTSLRYILHVLCQERSIGACQRIYGLIRAEPCRLQEETNHKVYLDIHLTHFNGIYMLMQKQLLPLEASSQLCQALESLGDLFEAMRLKNITKTGPLLERLNETLFGKRSKTFLKSLSFLPSESLSKMLGSLLRLLATSSTSELSNQFSEYLSFMLALVQIDMLSPEPSRQLSLQLLRMCKELFRQETNLTYALQLLYYYLKLLYVREATPNFKRNYIDLIRKFQNFFEHKATPHATEQWLTDLLVAIQRLQMLLQQSGSKLQSPFQVFWQQMEGEGSPEAYAAHFQLLHSCAGLAVNVTRSPLASSCSNEACTSVRRHCMLAFGLTALDAYINWQPTQEQKADRTPHKPLLGILSFTMDVAKSLKCLGPASIELIKLVRQLTHVADQVTCPEQIDLLCHLLEPLQKLRPLIPHQEMRGLLRRLFKASAYCKDPQRAGRLCASYLASLTNPARLRSQICSHYHQQGKEEKEIQRCIFEWHESCPLPYPLTPAEKKQLYDTDLFAALHYVRNPSVTHLKSLIRCRMSDYHLVLLARQLRNDGSILRECQELISKLKARSWLNRMEHLNLGHANVGLLLDALEAQKCTVSSKETGENQLEELLLRQNLSEISIQREQRLVNLASEAIAGFNTFFCRADEEPLGSEETAIDWEALIDDAVAAAMALSTMGYQAQADDAWLLLLRIGSMLMDRFTYLRALTHFLAQNEVNPRLKLDLSEEVERAEDLLDDLWPQLPSGRFFKRQDSTVMLCLCHLASYYARRECFSHAQLILLLVEQLRGELPERLGKTDIVLITLQTVRFRLNYEQRYPEEYPRMPTPLRQLDTLQDNVRNFCNLSSLDGGYLQLLLSTLVRESTECSANRLSERLAFSNIVLKLVLQSGLALRTIEVFLAWLWTNLQMENLDRAQSKLRLIEHCMGIKRLKRKEAEPLAMEKTEVQDPALSDLASNMHLLQLVEPIRKQQQHLDVALPSMLRPNSPSSQLSLDRYLNVSEAPAVIRGNFQLRSTYFIMGCLHARLCFLQRNSDQLDDFYASAESKLKESPELSDSLGSMLHVQQLYRANYLRFRGQHVDAITVAQLGMETPLQAMDIDYNYNFMTQLKTAELELKPENLVEAEGVQCQSLRRALNFLSPERKNETPSDKESSTKSAKKGPKFKIFTELELRPPSGSSGSSSEYTPPVNLDTCQPIVLSDDDDESPCPTTSLKPSLPKTTEKPKPKVKSKLNMAIFVDESPEAVAAPTPSQKVTGRSTRAARIRQPEETPKTATRRPRRAVAVTEPEQATEPEATGTRSRRRK
ncbi:protein three rows [Drosophila serrata]|uniref:protein three rows n=1 Tax=Drosophila serrata TaxID=7274 RepID=UPI000A1D0F9E|nr:protein three rows [Drosophila serrata]